MGGAAADDQQVAGAGRGAAAVAEDVAALELVDVEHGRGDAQRLAVAEPQAGADPRPDVEVGVRRRSPAQLVVGQVADPDRGASPSPAATTSFISACDLVEVRARGERQVERHAREPCPRPRASPAAARRSRAVKPCRCMLVSRSSTIAGVGLPLEQVVEVGEPADGVHHPLRRAPGRASTAAPKGRQG